MAGWRGIILKEIYITAMIRILRQIQPIQLFHRTLSITTTTTTTTTPTASDPPIDTSSDKTSTFHDFVEKGDINTVKQMIHQNADQDLVNQGDPGRSNTPPLHIASRSGHLNVIEYLVQQGADINGRGAWELTSLHYAVVFNQPEVVLHLLEHGADPLLKDVKGNTALDHAIKEEHSVIEKILRDN